MPYEHEKAILATLITHPELLSFFWDKGGSENFFISSEGLSSFQLICELDNRGKLNWNNIIEQGTGRIKATFICELQEKRIEVPLGEFSEKHLTILLDEVKNYSRKAEIQKIVASREKLNDVDIEAIIEISNTLINDIINTDESNTMQSAIVEYSGWKEVEKTDINTGFPTIDRYIGDLTWGEVLAIMGRTTTGKTFVAINILMHLVLSKVEKIGFFSMEMSKSALAERIIQVFSGKRRDKIDKIDIKSTEDRFKDVNIYSRVYSIFDIEGIVKRDDLKVIFIDFLQLVRGKGISLYEKTTKIIQEIKELAKNLDIIIIVLVQLSRKAGEGAEEVRLDMARDSGAIEENSDFILGIWNPGKKEKKGTELKDTRTIRLIKNKRGMTIGIDVYFNPDTGKMVEVGNE